MIQFYTIYRDIKNNDNPVTEATVASENGAAVIGTTIRAASYAINLRLPFLVQCAGPDHIDPWHLEWLDHNQSF